MKTVLVWGTFDILHPGHLRFLEDAKSHGGKLVVLVSRDKIAAQVKGAKPIHNEQERLQMIRALKIVDEAHLDSQEVHFQWLTVIKPDVICLGYDQTAFTQQLPEMLKQFNLQTKVIRLSANQPENHKSSIIKEKILNEH